MQEGGEQAADGHQDLAVHCGPSDVSRLRKAVVYSIAAWYASLDKMLSL